MARCGVEQFQLGSTLLCTDPEINGHGIPWRAQGSDDLIRGAQLCLLEFLPARASVITAPACPTRDTSHAVQSLAGRARRSPNRRCRHQAGRLPMPSVARPHQHCHSGHRGPVQTPLMMPARRRPHETGLWSADRALASPPRHMPPRGGPLAARPCGSFPPLLPPSLLCSHRAVLPPDLLEVASRVDVVKRVRCLDVGRPCTRTNDHVSGRGGRGAHGTVHQSVSRSALGDANPVGRLRPAPVAPVVHMRWRPGRCCRGPSLAL